MPEIYMIFARKIFSPDFWGQVPVSYAYALPQTLLGEITALPRGPLSGRRGMEERGGKDYGKRERGREGKGE